jgi:hypothetical protein
MNFFTMIVIIVAIVAFNKSCKYRTRADAQESVKSVEFLMRHINNLEDRLANLETIVIEKERERRFANL